MFENITDFNGEKFVDLSDGLSCECFADGIMTFLVFSKDGEEQFSVSGNEANDALDYILSRFYENEDNTIEDCFDDWLNKHQKPVISDVKSNNDYTSLSIRYEKLLNELKEQKKTISEQRKIISRLRKANKKLYIKLARNTKREKNA